jgi:hypothetical protein
MYLIELYHVNLKIIIVETLQITVTVGKKDVQVVGRTGDLDKRREMQLSHQGYWAVFEQKRNI